MTTISVEGEGTQPPAYDALQTTSINTATAEEKEPGMKTPTDATDENTDAKEEEDASQGGLDRVAAEIGGKHAWLKWFGHFVAILAGGVLPAFAWLFNEVLAGLGDPVLLADPPRLKQQALVNLSYFVAVGVGALISNFLLFAVWGTYGARIGVEVRTMYFEALLRQEIGYYDEKTSAVLNAKLVDDSKSIQAALGSKMGFAMQQLWGFIIGFALAFYFSWRMTLILLACMPVLCLIGAIQGYALGGAVDANSDPFTETSAFSQEVIMNIRTLYAFPQLVQHKIDQYADMLETLIPIVKKRYWIIGIGMGAIFGGLFGVVYAVGLWYGAFLVSEGLITIGDMFGCFFAFVFGAMGIGQMGSVAGDITAGRIGANNFWKIVERSPNMKQGNSSARNKTVQGNVSFEGVSFAYPVSPNIHVLKNVSFDLPAGSTLAIVGPSGSGKSTIVNLIERFYDPIGGQIRIDGELIENYDVEELRSQIGLVSQMPLLFDETIAQNISGGTEASEDQIIEAAKLANAHDFISELPRGYDTRVGEMGGRLSGGQRQRIAIARAMVSRPAILLLDEATSALDTKSEREVQAALDKIAAQKRQTIIVIAHRLSTIRDADRIMVLANGEMDSIGTHQELLEEDGLYAVLVRSQDLIATHRAEDM